MKHTSETYYVYILTNPLSHNAIYVGTSIDPFKRCTSHISHVVCSNGAVKSLSDEIKQILESGAKPFMSIVFESNELDEALRVESEMIKLLGFNRVHNKSHKTSKDKHNWNLENRQKISDALTGRKLTEEHKRKISESQQGEKNPFHGKTHTNEVKELMSLSKTGSNHPQSRLNEELVREIQLLIKDGLSNAEIAQQFNVSISTIKNIRYYKKWKHVL